MKSDFGFSDTAQSEVTGTKSSHVSLHDYLKYDKNTLVKIASEC